MQRDGPIRSSNTEEESASMAVLPDPERDVTDPIAQATLLMQTGHGTTRAPVAPMSADDMDNLPWPDFSQSMDVEGSDHRLAECIIISNYCPAPRGKKKKKQQQHKTAKRQSHDGVSLDPRQLATAKFGVQRRGGSYDLDCMESCWHHARILDKEHIGDRNVVASRKVWQGL